jgi:hypothetical protein
LSLGLKRVCSLSLVEISFFGSRWRLGLARACQLSRAAGGLGLVAWCPLLVKFRGYIEDSDADWLDVSQYRVVDF